VVGCGGAISYGGCVERYLGKAHLALGRWDEAVAELRPALATAEAADTPAMAAETAAHLATALVARGGEGGAAEATTLSDRFRPVAATLGMHPWVERFDALPLAPQGGDPGPLSPRELEVAALVARGLTNRQIATELYLSPRTAQNHVQHILTKLGLANRTQVAAWYRDAADGHPGR
jgi:DNA-binding NarL/FixJ family response regulator